MSFTVISLGGPVAQEGEAMLREAGIISRSTAPYPKKAELIALLSEQQPDAVIVRNVERIDAEIMRASPKLKVVAKHGAGTNDIDVAAAGELGLPVLAAVGCNAHSVAEHALALLLGLAKDLRGQDEFVRGGNWAPKRYAGRELRGQTLGLIGLGMIGRALAGMAAALGMWVVAYDPFAPEDAFGPSLARIGSVETLLAESDAISLHAPLTDATRNLIDARTIGLMKPGALLINTARGELVDEAALLDALRSGKLGGAGLDTFAPEPPAPQNPLWQMPNLIVSPHIGGVTEEARREVSVTTVRNVISLLRGEAPHPRFFVKG